MEFYSKQMKKALKKLSVSLLTVSLGIGVCACESEEVEPQVHTSLENGVIGLNYCDDGSQYIRTDKGEIIMLTDTVTHVLDFTEYLGDESNDVIDYIIPTRAVEYKGFDYQSIQKDNKKYMLNGLERFGFSPNVVYVGKFNYYYKNLPARSGYYISPNNRKYANLVQPYMGFNPPSITDVGYHIYSSTSTVEVGITTLFYVVSDISGISWNKNVPCSPEELTWYFQYVEE